MLDNNNENSSSSSKRELFTIKQCPEYMQSNEFIHEGYRRNYSKIQCILSIFMITNETVNIWSHLLGCVCFMYFIWQVNMNILPGYSLSNGIDHVVMTLFCLCFMVCMLLSTCYHVFSCHSKLYSDQCLRSDLMGITLSLWGCYIPSLYYGFYCFKLWRSFYTCGIILMMILNMAFQYLPRRVYTQKTDYRRIFFFCVLCLFGIFPAAHWFYLLGGFSNELVQCFIPRIVTMYAIGAVAFGFYWSKVPEKLFPGRFDFLGASHQCWHTLVLGAFIWWYYSALELIKIRLGDKNTCLVEYGLSPK